MDCFICEDQQKESHPYTCYLLQDLVYFLRGTPTETKDNRRPTFRICDSRVSFSDKAFSRKSRSLASFSRAQAISSRDVCQRKQIDNVNNFFFYLFRRKCKNKRPLSLREACNTIEKFAIPFSFNLHTSRNAFIRSSASMFNLSIRA